MGFLIKIWIYIAQIQRTVNIGAFYKQQTVKSLLMCFFNGN